MDKKTNTKANIKKSTPIKETNNKVSRKPDNAIFKVSVDKFQKNLHRYKIDFHDAANHVVPIMLTSDWHFDNPKTNRALLFKHLDDVKEKNGLIIINGDTLCLMQGKYDPRRSKGSVRLEHNGDNYLDLVINDTADKLLPYANNILQINVGNHESAVSQKTETDVLQRLVERINTLANTNIQLGSYMGMIILSFKGKNTTTNSLNVAYSHGHWGGVISKGTQASMRYAQMFPDADVVISGHTHDSWIMPLNRYKYNQNNMTFDIKTQWHIKTGTYKEEFEEGSGWAVEKIGTPKNLGSCMMDVFYDRHNPLRYEFKLIS